MAKGSLPGTSMLSSSSPPLVHQHGLQCSQPSSLLDFAIAAGAGKQNRTLSPYRLANNIIRIFVRGKTHGAMIETETLA